MDFMWCRFLPLTMGARRRVLPSIVFAGALAVACNDGSPTSPTTPPANPTPAPVSTPRPGADLAGAWSGFVTELPAPDGDICKTDPTPVHVKIVGSAGQFHATFEVGQGSCLAKLVCILSTNGNDLGGSLMTSSLGCDFTGQAFGTATVSAIHISASRLHGECGSTIGAAIDLTR